jgi:hypothetical protein
MIPTRKLLFGGAIAAASVAGGAIGASFLGTANAQTATTTPGTESPTTPTQGQPRQAPDWSKGGHQANGKTETLLTGDDASKATASAEAAVPGATAQRAETDAEGTTYEVHMTKSDGSIVTVKLDSSFNVTQTIDGMG